MVRFHSHVPGKDFRVVMPLLQSGMMTRRRSRMLIVELRLRVHCLSEIHGAKDGETEDMAGYHTSTCSTLARDFWVLLRLEWVDTGRFK